MQPGTRVGEYEMVRPLGSGGMAEVWLARNPHMNRSFAVKFILPQLAPNWEIQTRFRDEAWRQSGLHHPNIVQILTVLSESGQNYIVMEYAESGLDKKLEAQAGSPLPIPEAMDISLQVLDALQYTHTLAEGALIHRDIKPSNILLKEDGSVRLTDFGIALATNQARRTMTGQVLGTALYMSPEQIVAPSRVGPQSDIYSFGCVLYEMLTGRPPFGSDKDTDFSVQSDHVNKFPDPVRRFNVSVPERFEWIVLKALAKDASMRFASAREMAQALLTAYREEGLPVDLLRSYHGGLTSGPIQPSVEPSYTKPQAQYGGQPHSSTTNPPVNPWQSTTPPQPVWPAQTIPPNHTVPPAPTIPPNRTIPPGQAVSSGQTIPPVHTAPYAYQAPNPAQTIPPGYVAPGFPQHAQTIPPQQQKRGKAWILWLSLALLFLIAAGLGAWYYTRDNEILRLEGSTSVGDELAPALARDFLNMQLHATDVDQTVESVVAPDGSKYQIFKIGGRVGMKREVIRIVSNGSGKAFKALDTQGADLGMSSRPYSPTDDPAQLSYLPSSNSNEHVIALDGIAVIVNNDNRVENLSLDQLKRIFTGDITSWNDVKGSGGRIHCYGRDENSGTFEIFRNKVVGKKGKLSAIASQDRFPNGPAVVEKIASDPDGIGYVTFTQTKGTKRIAVSDQGTLPMDPNSLTVSTEDYVLTRRLYLYEPKDASKTAKDFVAFAQSPQGQVEVHEKEFVSLMPTVHEEPAPAEAPPDYKAAVSGLERLGVSFRFTSGKGSLESDDFTLDSLAQDNLLRLKAYVDEHPGDEIILLGFTDNKPDPNISNRDLSIKRARSVAVELGRSNIPSQVRGLGDEEPVASNLTPDGRAKNRRVEVWVRPGRS